MTLLVVYFLLAIFVSFLCSLLESVMLSVSPAHISIMAQEGRQSGKILQELKAQIDRPLAAILTINTVANTVGAAGVGAQVHKIYGNEYVTAASAVLTLMILIFSEIIPKTMGATYWKVLAPLCAYLIRVLIFVAYPFVLFSEILYSLLSKGNSQRMTREEMIVTAELSANDGTLRQKESLVIRNLLMLDKVKVSDIMTPRSVTLAFEENQTVGQVMSKHKPIRFSRIPVFIDSMDHVIGMVHRYKLMEAASHDQSDLPIKSLMQPLQSISEELSVAAALDQFIKYKEHVFLVINDYGSTTGLVSLEDVVETLLGVEIVDEFDSVADMRQYARELWRERKQKTWIANKA